MNWEKVKKRSDNIWLGVAIGLLLPILGFILAKAIKDKQGSYTYGGFWNLLVGENVYYMDILTFSLLPNMLAFYVLFFMWKMDKAVRGLVFSTIMILGGILLLH